MSHKIFLRKSAGHMSTKQPVIWRRLARYSIVSIVKVGWRFRAKGTIGITFTHYQNAVGVIPSCFGCLWGIFQ